MIERTVWCQCSFEGFHCWPNAPDEVKFLRDIHRHIFHIKVTWKVSHSDRDLEFITLKKQVLEAIGEINGLPQTRNWSCEHWAEYLLSQFPYALEATVSEDGENGATLKRICQ